MRLQRIRASDAAARGLLRVVAPLFMAGLGSHAFALGLGEASVASVLGQPLKMTVPLVMEPGVELAQECVRIIPGSQLDEAIPTLNGGRIAVDAEGHQLRIESLQPISEPTLRVVVEIGCNDRVRREFALLLDPPLVAEPPVKGDVAGSVRTGPTESSIGLGMAQISAVLGQRLSLKVPVVGTGATNLTAGCVRLADPISKEGAPVLRQADIRVLPEDAGALIEVVTPDPVIEPAVRLALDVGCREPLRREYAILLGLPALAASNADAIAAAAPPEPVAKPAPKRVAKAPRVVTAVPVAPDTTQRTAPVARPAQAAAKGPPAAAPGLDRLVLSSPEDQAKPAVVGGATPDPNSELLNRLDAMSKRIETLEAQLSASRQREQELEQRAFEAREQWTWSMAGLGGLLLAGALVLAWRQRHPPAQPAWEAVVKRVRPATVSKPAAGPQRGASTVLREAPEIGGRATMAPAPSTAGGATEPALADHRDTEITVTELHDTVQVIKELYATVLERNSSGTTGGRPLELDLRTPTRASGSAASAARRSDSARVDALQSARGGAEKRGLGEAFTELPTEVSLDLDLSSIVAQTAPESGLTGALAKQGDDWLPPRAGRPPSDAGRSGEPAGIKAVGNDSPAANAGQAAANGARAAAGPAPHKDEGADEHLTQTPTEVSIDIDVGATTGFPKTIGRPAPRVSVSTTQRPEQRPRSDRATLEPIDLQLDLDQPEASLETRGQRSA